MKRIDGLVIGSPGDFDLLGDDIAGRDGVVLARTKSGPNGGLRRGAPANAAATEPARDALRSYLPRHALFLSPYRGLAADAARLMENGVDVRTAGPLPVRSHDISVPVAELHRTDPGFAALQEASRNTDFGAPVYLRLISSAEDGRWHTWWCLFQMCRKAVALLNAPLRRLYVAAAGTAPRMHVSVTLKTDRNTTGHLLIAPKGGVLRDDLLFVGTGGTLSDDALLNQPGVFGRSDYRMLPRPTRRRLADLWSNTPMVCLTGAEQRFYWDLLRAIGDSSRSRSGFCLEYPAVA